MFLQKELLFSLIHDSGIAFETIQTNSQNQNFMRLVNYAIVLIVICFSFSFSTSPESQAWDYIDQYKELAVAEMYRTGIPASITLAQGLHESNYGQSRLASEANNHFGIKCKSYWVGNTFYHEDDDYNKKGKLIESCFRSYNSSLESYVDHSNFLKTTKHYQPLFEYHHTDYKNWAIGLKQCGYATDAAYTKKLLDKIEKYYLYQYDFWENPFRSVVK